MYSFTCTKRVLYVATEVYRSTLVNTVVVMLYPAGACQKVRPGGVMALVKLGYQGPGESRPAHCKTTSRYNICVIVYGLLEVLVYSSTQFHPHYLCTWIYICCWHFIIFSCTTVPPAVIYVCVYIYIVSQ